MLNYAERSVETMRGKFSVYPRQRIDGGAEKSLFRTPVKPSLLMLKLRFKLYRVDSERLIFRTQPCRLRVKLVERKLVCA